MQRKLVTLVNCQLVEAEGRARAVRSARSLGERSVTELILQVMIMMIMMIVRIMMIVTMIDDSDDESEDHDDILYYNWLRVCVCPPFFGYHL